MPLGFLLTASFVGVFVLVDDIGFTDAIGFNDVVGLTNIVDCIGVEGLAEVVDCAGFVDATGAAAVEAFLFWA